MINLKSLVPGEEVAELESLGQADYSDLDNIEGVTSDTIARMKETLAEALNTLFLLLNNQCTVGLFHRRRDIQHSFL